MQRRRGSSATARGILGFISFGITRIGIDSHRIDCCILLELLGSDAQSGYLHLVILLHSTFSSVCISLRCRNLLEGISSDPIITNSSAAHLHISSALDQTAATIPTCTRLVACFDFTQYSPVRHLPEVKASSSTKEVPFIKPPSAVRRRWTLSLSDGIFDTLLKITTRHTINFHEYNMETAIWQHTGRRNRRKKWKRCDGTGRQDRICGYVDGLRMLSLPTAAPALEREDRKA